jgi:hypothetical protein
VDRREAYEIHRPADAAEARRESYTDSIPATLETLAVLLKNETGAYESIWPVHAPARRIFDCAPRYQ